MARMQRKKYRLFFGMILIFSACFPGKGYSQEVLYLSPDSFYLQYHSAVNPVLIDVRTSREFRKFRLPGALPAEKAERLFAITDTLDAEQSLFIYCEETSRSGTASALLATKGFTRIYVLRGGILQWMRAGLPLDRDKKGR